MPGPRRFYLCPICERFGVYLDTIKTGQWRGHPKCWRCRECGTEIPLPRTPLPRPRLEDRRFLFEDAPPIEIDEEWYRLPG